MWGLLARFQRQAVEPMPGPSWEHHVIDEVYYEPSTGYYHVDKVRRERTDGSTEVSYQGHYIPATVTPHVGDEVGLLIEGHTILRMWLNGVEIPLPWIAADRSA